MRHPSLLPGHSARAFKCSLFLSVIAAVMLAACGQPQVPAAYTDSPALPDIYPDYVDVTIPVNIAPLAFEMNDADAADEMVVRFTAKSATLVCGGEKAQPDADSWQQLTGQAKGGAISVEVFARKDSQWTRFKPFSIYVSPDSIDPYISYRLISPSFISYEELTISQRCLENYDESVVYDNVLCSFEKDGQCINCHNYQQYNPQRMQFHARQNQGGTVIAYDGKLKKVNMRNDSILSAGVYPAWHPWLKLIVYSTDKTHQVFHTQHRNKVEVFDEASDLIAYNVDQGEVTNLENDPDEWEVFPCWAPDGKTLYYCSARLELRDSTLSKSTQTVRHIGELKYNIYKKHFEPETMQFGERELVFDAAAIDSSAVLPRISPDGRYLVFTMTQFGYFPIWHHDADLWMLDLKTGESRALHELNSADTESYHSWSSNGRWMIFSSRRDDGVFTRPFIGHIGSDGRGSKPFELPCADPDFHRKSMKCYNIPEFMRGPVTISPQQFADVLKGDAEPVKYVGNLSKE